MSNDEVLAVAVTLGLEIRWFTGVAILPAALQAFANAIREAALREAAEVCSVDMRGNFDSPHEALIYCNESILELIPNHQSKEE